MPLEVSQTYERERDTLEVLAQYSPSRLLCLSRNVSFGVWRRFAKL